MVSLLFVLSGLITLSFAVNSVSINEVGKLLKHMQPVMFSITSACRTKTTDKNVIPAAGVKTFFPFESCRISNLESDPPKVILNDDEEKIYGEDRILPAGSASDPEFRALFLLQLSNTVSYMILNPEKAHWLFTNPLSGCDIFIATSRNEIDKPDRRDFPLVFHANYDSKSLPNQHVENLEWKGNKVDQILDGVPGNYALRARIFVSPIQVTENYKQYIHNYIAAHPGILMLRYNVPPQNQFYGHYETVWEFFLKNSDNGFKTDIDIQV